MRPNIYAVAEKAGVATSTVSRALRGDERIRPETRRRVEQAARELGYVPQVAAQVLAGTKLRTLGMVLPRIVGTYYAELAVGFEQRASELDCSVMILQVDEKTDTSFAIRRLAGQCDAIAFLARSKASDELVAETAHLCPVITVARSALEGVPAIFAESERQAEELTTHLVERGRRKLAFVGPVDPGSDIETRYAGFRLAMDKAGIAAPPPINTPMDEVSGRALAHRLLEQGLEYDALVCGNDEVAVAIVHELQELGVDVPGQVAVVGWDDITVSRFLRPGLTTVSQPVNRLGALAAELLPRLIDKRDVEARTVLPASIVHRQSCGCD